jgi:hypothetical protein
MPPFPLVNGYYHQFASIELDLDGDTVVGFTAIEYSDNIERGDVRGARRQRLGVTRGEYKADASLEMYRRDFYELLNRLGDGWMDRVFPIHVTYGEDGQPLVTDELVRCRFKGTENSHQQGNDPLKIKLPLDVDGILYAGKLPFVGFQR